MDLKTYLSCKRGRSSWLASAVGVTPATVSEWAAKKKSVPAERCPAIERATDGAVRCEDLRPDVDWGYLRRPATSAPSRQESA